MEYGYDQTIARLNIALTMYAEATNAVPKDCRLLLPPIDQSIMMKAVDALKDIIDALKGNVDYGDVRKRAAALYVSACSTLGKKHELTPLNDFIYEGQEYEQLRVLILGAAEQPNDAEPFYREVTKFLTALVEGCKKHNLIYPYYETIDSVAKEGSQEVNKTRHKGMYGFWAWFAAAVMGIFGWLTSPADGGSISGICYTIAIGFVILGVLQTTLGLIKTAQANKLQREYQQKTDKLEQEKDDELNKEFQLFFNHYKGVDSIKQCTEVVRKSSSFSCKDEEISCHTP